MIWLTFFGNEALLVLAETLVIIVGSMLLGILLSYFHWGGERKEKEELASVLTEEKRKEEDLRDQVTELMHAREHLKTEISEFRMKADAQAKTIYDLNQHLYLKETEIKNQKEQLDQLHATVDSYQHRLKVIEDETIRQKSQAPKEAKKTVPPVKARANYEQVSQLLGRQVTHNDLTLITGIGPKTASVLQANGIKSWDKLATMPIKKLKDILEAEGGIYKSIDPSTWPKQALMASKSEWRKLRLFQEALKRGE